MTKPVVPPLLEGIVGILGNEILIKSKLSIYSWFSASGPFILLLKTSLWRWK
jgi:hypothetical protein